MTDYPFLIGIDPQIDGCRAVRVRVDGPRPEVVGALRITADHPAPPDFCANAAVMVAIPDDKVIVKNIAVPDGGPNQPDRALFELAQSLTTGETEYLLGFAPTGLASLALGLAVHGPVLDSAVIGPIRETFAGVDPVRAIARGLALAHGYLTFCSPVAGGLVVLADVAKSLTSVAIVYNQKAVALASFVGEFGTGPASDPDRFAVELKTLISFRLAALFNYGLTLPPTALIVSGKVDERLKTALRRYFAVPVEEPDINAGFVAAPFREDLVRTRDYLVAMGLTAKLLA